MLLNVYVREYVWPFILPSKIYKFSCLYYIYVHPILDFRLCRYQETWHTELSNTGVSQLYIDLGFNLLARICKLHVVTSTFATLRYHLFARNQSVSICSS